LARRTRPLRTRWRTLDVGARLEAGATTFEIRLHPALAGRPDTPDAGGSIGEGLGLRLLFPLVMCASSLPLLLGSSSGPWRIALFIALPVLLVGAVLWPALRQRARRRREEAVGTHPADEPAAEDGPSMMDPCAVMLTAAHPWTRPVPSGWEIGSADRTGPPPRADGRARARDRRRRAALSSVPPPEPGNGVALVGEPTAVSALGRWLVCQLAVGRAPLGLSLSLPASWTWAATLPHAAGHALDVDGMRVCLVDLTPVPVGTGFRPDPGTRSIVLARDVHHVPSWCTRIVEVRPTHDRRVGTEWAGRIARTLAEADRSREGLPSAVGLVDLLGPLEPQRLATAWRAAGGLGAVIGVDAQGPVLLDLARDGPHALIAGTTGSGKSELLLAWVLAIAHAHAPADVAFVLVDYKGGATFAALADLPHVVGVLTDLDGGATARALASLRAELRRRERVLAACGAANLEDQRRRTTGELRLGRLVVVVDEFRAMADEHPDFLDGLVRLAAQGRSLGIHLLLATQRPGGAITPDMRANLTVRICLRVLEDVDSLDLLGDTSAARLPAVPGRAVLRVESNHVMQSAWCGAAEDDVVTRVKDSVRAAAGLLEADEPWRARVTPPWAPPLADRICVDDLPPGPAGSSAELPLLRTDLPEQQRLGSWHLLPTGSLLVSGPPASGRTTALHTLAQGALGRGLVTHVLAEEPLAVVGHDGPDSPALGTVCPVSDTRRARRLIELLTDTPAAGHRLLLVDDVDALCLALDGTGGIGEGIELFTALLRQSRRTGLGVVLTAASPATRWAALVPDHLVLAPRDAADAIMAGVPRTLAGSGWPPGRGVLLTRGEARLAHVATGPTAHGPRPAPAIGPLRLAALPDRVDLPVQQDGPGIAIGVGGDHAHVVRAELPRAGTWLVTGPNGSGRSTVLRTIAARLRHRGIQVWQDPADVRAGADGVLVLDDVDRLSPSEVAAAGSALAGGPVALVASSRPDPLLTAYHEVAARLRDAPTMVVLGSTAGAMHLTGADLRRFTDAGTRRPGRAVLLDRGRIEPLQLDACSEAHRTPSGEPVPLVAATDAGRSRPASTTTASTIGR
ncbi:MAG: hypothetical protein JJE50_10710, partial [Actinomycetales bacterium]|nr:hypothetical protein [Actinomycetales bacterium]